MMGLECYKLEYIGIVKCNDWHDLDDINQCGWCFDYNENVIVLELQQGVLGK